MKKTKVAIVKVEEDVHTAVEKAINLIGRPRKYFSGDVLIKPNLFAPLKPEACVTTEPSIIQSVIRIAKEYSKNINVGESAGFISTPDAIEKFKVCGIEEVCREESVRQVIFESLKQKKVKLKYSNKVKDVFLPEDCLTMSLINVPKIKTHLLTYLTCGIKNLFGCVTGFQKSRIHKSASNALELSRVLLSLNEILKPKLTIVDGINCMEGNGPVHGKPIKLGLILAGEDPIAVDSVVAELIGFERGLVPVLHLAQQLDLGPTSLDNIHVIGEEIEHVKKIFKKPVSMSYPKLVNIPRNALYSYTNFTTKPHMIKKNCKKCRNCITYCPTNAISFKGYPEIDYKKCIKCFCCYELCIHKAISTKKVF